MPAASAAALATCRCFKSVLGLRLLIDLLLDLELDLLLDFLLDLLRV